MTHTPPPVSIDFDLRQYPTLHATSLSNAIIRTVRGPAGSAKSTWAFVDLLRKSCEQAPGQDGVRRTRWLVGRNTYSVLVSATLETARKTLGPLFKVRESIPPSIEGKFSLEDGTRVEVEFEFLALDGEDAMQRLLGYEPTGAFLDELSELPEKIVHAVLRRIGRYPSGVYGKPTWTGLIGVTNGPLEGHWLHKWEMGENAEILAQLSAEIAKSSGEDRPFFHAFAQPAALVRPASEDATTPEGKWRPNPDAENITNLPGGYGYYFAMLADTDDAKIRAYVEGEFAQLKRGRVVFPQFKPTLHVLKADKFHLPMGTPLGLSFDFGRTPVCGVFVRHSSGRLILLDELMGEDMAVETLARSMVLPLLKSKYRGSKVEWATGDPAGESGGQGLEMSPYEVLWGMGIPIENPGGGNNLGPRIEAVAQYLTRLDTFGVPMLQVRDNCTFTTNALARNYIYEASSRANPDLVRDTPTKSHVNWVSDLADMVQYACLYNAPTVVKVKKPQPPLRKLKHQWG